MKWTPTVKIALALGLLTSCSSNATPPAPDGTGGASSGGQSSLGGASGVSAGGVSAGGYAATAGGAVGTSGATTTASGGGGAAASAGADSGGSGGASAAGSGNAGGSGGDTSASGAGGIKGGAGGATASTCAGLLLCDDFEAYAANAAPGGPWKAQVRGSATAVVDATKAYSGTKSVHFTGTVNQSSANIVAQGAPTFPVTGNTVFIRLMMFVQGYPTTSGVHTRLARIGSSTSGLDGTGYALTTYNGTGIERINEAMVRDTSLHLTDTTVAGKWVCWEWQLDNTAGPPAGTKGKVLPHLWRDGTEVTLSGASHTDLSWDPVAWQILEIGLEAYQSDTKAGDFWIDDVALDTKRIGCPKQ